MELKDHETLGLSKEDEEEDDEEDENDPRLKNKSFNRFSLWFKRFKFLDQEDTNDEEKTKKVSLTDILIDDDQSSDQEKHIIDVAELDPEIQQEIVAEIAKYNLDQLGEQEKLELPHTVDFLEDLSESGQLIPVFQKKIEEIYSSFDNADQLPSIFNNIEKPGSNSIDTNQFPLMTDNNSEVVAPIPIISDHHLESSHSFFDNYKNNSHHHFKSHSLEDFMDRFLSSRSQKSVDRVDDQPEIRAQNPRHLERLYQAVEEKTIVLKNIENKHNLPRNTIEKDSFSKKATQSTKEVLTSINQQFIVEKPSSNPITESYQYHLSDAEYLNLAQKIKAESINLKQLYINKKISINGLKRVVQEYLRTGDISQYLQMELIERQKDFEKDPLFRDVRKTMQELKVDHQKELSQRVADIIQEKQSIPPIIQSRQDSLPSIMKPKKINNVSGIDLALIAVIVCLVFLILILLIIKL